MAAIGHRVTQLQAMEEQTETDFSPQGELEHYRTLLSLWLASVAKRLGNKRLEALMTVMNSSGSENDPGVSRPVQRLVCGQPIPVQRAVFAVDAFYRQTVTFIC